MRLLFGGLFITIIAIFMPLCMASPTSDLKGHVNNNAAQENEEEASAESAAHAFYGPDVHWVDICWSSNRNSCEGERAANKFCESKGYSSAHSFQYADSSPEGTIYLADSTECPSDCSGFIYIACE
jgi:hypothetical protein